MLFPPEQDRKVHWPRQGYADSYIRYQVKDWTAEDIKIADRSRIPVALMLDGDSTDALHMTTLVCERLNGVLKPACARIAALDLGLAPTIEVPQPSNLLDNPGEIDLGNGFGLRPMTGTKRVRTIGGDYHQHIIGWAVVMYTDDDVYFVDRQGDRQERPDPQAWHAELGDAVCKALSLASDRDNFFQTRPLNWWDNRPCSRVISEHPVEENAPAEIWADRDAHAGQIAAAIEQKFGPLRDAGLIDLDRSPVLFYEPGGIFVLMQGILSYEEAGMLPTTDGAGMEDAA